jgi:hypothetical protein
MRLRTPDQQQQQSYQQQLLQQQQQQMAQFQNAASFESNGIQVQSPISMSSTSSQLPLGAPLSSAPRYAMPPSLTNSRMGPPSHQGQGSSSMASTSATAFAGPFSYPASTAAHSESTSYFGPGAGLARLHQYSEALKEGPDRQSSEYWKSFVDEFYLPQSTMHLVLWNPTTREQKGFGESQLAAGGRV